MAHAMRHATAAGRLAYLAGRIPKKLYATASRLGQAPSATSPASKGETSATTRSPRIQSVGFAPIPYNPPITIASPHGEPIVMPNGKITTANKIKLGLALLGLLIVIILIGRNMQSVKTDFLFFPVEMPLALLLIIALLIGFGIGMLSAWITFSRKKL